MRSIKIIQPPKSIHAKLDQSLCWCDAGVAGGQSKRGRGEGAFGCMCAGGGQREEGIRVTNHKVIILCLFKCLLVKSFEAIYRREFLGFKFRPRMVLTAGGTLRGRRSAARTSFRGKFWKSPKSDFHKKQPCKTHGNGV